MLLIIEMKIIHVHYLKNFLYFHIFILYFDLLTILLVLLFHLLIIFHFFPLKTPQNLKVDKFYYLFILIKLG